MPNFFEQLTRELAGNRNVMTFSDMSSACTQAAVGASFAGQTKSPAVLVPACVGGVAAKAVEKVGGAVVDLTSSSSSSSAPKPK